MHGVHKSKRLSGYQQRKAKEARNKSLKKLARSMLQFFKRPDDDQGSSKDIVSQCQSPIENANSSDASMYSAEEQVVDVAEFEAEQGVEVENCEAEESAERDSSLDTVNDMSDLREKDLQILHDVSFWEIPVADHFRVEIIKRGSAYFQNKDGPFSAVARQDSDTKSKGDVHQLSKQWFCKMMPNGEKILRSWMVYSVVSEKLYCFCCRLFAVSVTSTSSKFVTGFQTWWKLSPKVHKP